METELEEKNKKEEIKRKIRKARKNGEILPLTTDDCFKIMFANQAHLETLTFLISKVLNLKYDMLKGNIRLEPTKVTKTEIGKKQEERDLVVYVKPIETKLIIEVTYDKELLDHLGEYFLENRDDYIIKILRDLYYASAVHGNSLGKGEGYDKLNALFLLEFNPYFIDKDHKEFYEEYQLRNKYGHILTENIKIININVVKCRKLWYYNTYKSDEFDDHEKDLILLGALLSAKNIEEVDRCLQDINTTLEIKKLIKGVIVKMNNNDEAWGRFYDPEEERKRLNDSALAYSRKRGLKEGKEIGLIEGRKEREQEMVISLYNQNVSIDIISKASGLSQEEVEEIINNSKNK